MWVFILIVVFLFPEPSQFQQLPEYVVTGAMGAPQQTSQAPPQVIAPCVHFSRSELTFFQICSAGRGDAVSWLRGQLLIY
jgi:hypothetical protein